MQPPPRPTIVPSRPIRSARHSRSSTAIAFAGSPGGTSWRADVAAAERELRRDTVDPGHVRVGDDLDRTRPRDELLEQLERADPDVDRPPQRARCRRRRGRARPPISSYSGSRSRKSAWNASSSIASGLPPSRARALPRDTGLDLEQHRERTARAASSGSCPRGQHHRRARSRPAPRNRGSRRRWRPLAPGTPARLPGRRAPRSSRRPGARSRGRGRRTAGRAVGQLPRPASSSPRP